MEPTTLEKATDTSPISRSRLYIAVLSVNLLYTCGGCVTAWTSPTLPKLTNVLSENQAALVGSLFSFGAAFGPIISLLCLDRLGRKGLLYILGGCYFVSWIILAPSTNVYLLYIGRIIGGFGVGGTFSSACIFVAEIADKDIRGTVGSFNIISLSLGFLMQYCIGPYTSYLTLVIVSAIPSVLFVIMFFFIPESPYYLMLKDRKADAEKSLSWYRGYTNSHMLEQEIGEIEESIKFTREHKAGVGALCRRGPLKALGISLFVLLLQQGAGGNAIISFAQKIFELSHAAVSGPVCAMIGGITNLLAGLLAPIVVRRFSIRPTFFVSTFIMAISLGLLSIYFYLQSSNVDVSKVSFLPILAFITYNAMLSLGIGPLPWTIVAELFPIEIKSIASCICGVFSSLVGFAIIEVSGILLTSDGPAIVFASFCIFVVVATFISIFIIPNNTGLTLQEIQDYLETGIRPIPSVK